MQSGNFPSSDLYVRAIVGEQVRSLREIIHSVGLKEPLSEETRFLDHLLQMVSLAANAATVEQPSDLRHG
ncbi:hypothetical protein [Peteryoungia ipomoeae]|uniref:Uncharacterized protein n=1 Tax=Peteryoungia ipomoeae TaxID=1210932 RepID=A0A4V4HNA9_9HYPH|nr:hypothetical protein [Peteryoungia ipomoeae]THV25356.1 hypothetical protein FAA97_03930 [Peteryoungia ipomoeae]